MHMFRMDLLATLNFSECHKIDLIRGHITDNGELIINTHFTL